MRFGIGMNTDHTLEEVGQQFSVTRERIRQIEAESKTSNGQRAEEAQASEPKPEDAEFSGSVGGAPRSKLRMGRRRAVRLASAPVRL
jgi:hypothetical protein